MDREWDLEVQTFLCIGCTYKCNSWLKEQMLCLLQFCTHGKEFKSYFSISSLTCSDCEFLYVTK